MVESLNLICVLSAIKKQTNQQPNPTNSTFLYTLNDHSQRIFLYAHRPTQVQDSLSKSKQETTTAVSTTSGTDLASIEKPSRSSSTKPSRSSSSSNPSSTHSTPASPSSATVTSGGGGGVAVMVSPAPKKKVWYLLSPKRVHLE